MYVIGIILVDRVVFFASWLAERWHRKPSVGGADDDLVLAA